MTCIVLGIIALLSGLGLYLGADAKLNSLEFWWENAGKSSYDEMEMMRSMGIMVAVLGIVLLIVGIVMVIVKKNNENQEEQTKQMEQTQLQWQQIQQVQMQQQQQFQQMAAQKENFQPGPQCPRCGKILQNGMRFCPMCGLDLNEKQEQKPKTCAVCGEVLADDAVFCTACGTKINQ